MVAPAEKTRLRLAVVGLGRGATLTAPALIEHDRVEVVGGCDPSSEARDGFADAVGVAAVRDIDDLLADGAIDALYIASPHESHAAHAIAAARAGKHVLVEKPMAVGIGDAAAMARAASDAGRIMMVGPSHGFDPLVSQAAELIADRVGEARLIHAANFTDFLYRPRRVAELDSAQGGGVVFSQASHQIDIVRRLAGSEVVSVRGWVGNYDPMRRADGAYSALLTFANGAAATLTYSGYARYDSDAQADWIGEMGHPKDQDAHRRTRLAYAAGDEQAAKAARGFAGTSDRPPASHHERFGSVVACCLHADLELSPDGVIVHDNAGATLHRAPLPRAPRFDAVDAFVRATLDGDRPLFDARWGITTLACCHAILLSAETGRDHCPGELLEMFA